MLAGEGGFEPPHTDPESAVLPLDDSPAHYYLVSWQRNSSTCRRTRQVSVRWLTVTSF